MKLLSSEDGTESKPSVGILKIKMDILPKQNV